MNTTPTDTPETDSSSWLVYDPISKFEREVVPVISSRALERRALAAEARVRELEAANAELIQRLQDRVESYLAASKRDVQTTQQQAIELDRLRAALRLRPIAEAGPVPEGAVRLWAWRNDRITEWIFTDYPCHTATHVIDIYTPPQAEEGGQA